MVILNRNINLTDDRELVEDVTTQEIADKGLDFNETFWQVHQGYVRNRRGEEIRVTDREIFNMVDNLLRVEGIRAIGARVLSLHRIRKPD